MLRPYQAHAIESLRWAISEGKKRVLLTIPTGGGKTLLASEVVRLALARGRSVLFVVHLRELVDQTVRALARCGVEHVGVIRGDDGRFDPSAPVQIASIQTLVRRKKPSADVVFIDEAHRSISRTYKTGVWDAYPDAHVFGLTATPCRTDGKPLGDRYEHLIIGATYSELIALGYIADPIVIAPRVTPDLSRVRRVAGDYDEEQLGEAMKELSGHIIPTWERHARGVRTVVFAVSIDHSKNIVRRFQDAGVAAEHLDGETPAAERAAMLERLRTGETTVLSNCAVLTEGFDMPAIRCAILARPTLSLVLHMQTAGRALRPGERQPVIIDHAGNIARHGMPHEDRVWSLKGAVSRERERLPWKTCPDCFAYVKRTAKACPHCGLEFRPEPAELPTEVAVEMVEIKRDDVEHQFFVEQLCKASAIGLRPGFASVKFKERYGRWPPKPWSDRARAMMEADPAWQWRINRRAEGRQ